MNKAYEEPKFVVVSTSRQDILTLSEGDDFNMLGDRGLFYKNSNWTIEV